MVPVLATEFPDRATWVPSELLDCPRLQTTALGNRTNLTEAQAKGRPAMVRMTVDALDYLTQGEKGSPQTYFPGRRRK